MVEVLDFETLVKAKADEEEIVFPSLRIHYVDDVLAYWTSSEEGLLTFCIFLYALRQSIKFTIEGCACYQRNIALYKRCLREDLWCFSDLLE